MICAFDVSSAPTHYFPASAVLDFQSVSFAVSDWINSRVCCVSIVHAYFFFSVLVILVSTRESWKRTRECEPYYLKTT